MSKKTQKSKSESSAWAQKVEEALAKPRVSPEEYDAEVEIKTRRVARRLLDSENDLPHIEPSEEDMRDIFSGVTGSKSES